MNKSIFTAPKSLDELKTALSKKTHNTYIVAGGTDLAVGMNKNKIYDFSLIDITKIKELKKIEYKDDLIEIGSCVRMVDLENNEIINKYVPSLSKAASSIGSTQIRNLATIGGNIANAAQCADTVAVLFAFDAEAEIMNSKGEIRKELVYNIIQGIGQTSIKKDEVIIKILLKGQKTNEFSSFSKIGARKAVTISKINACIKLRLEDNIIVDSRVYIGSIGVKAVRSLLIEDALNKNVLNKDLKEKILELGSKQVLDSIPKRKSKEYKKIAVKGILDDIFSDIEKRRALNG
jgi:CO/xanthine dehydrogenase FAD-binding subunit